ncbi:hypothetical protein N806_02245 [Rhodococcus sp. P27]|nr:hypothetical protein N806_02245 [Rhodococcus sp. P27]
MDTGALFVAQDFLAVGIEDCNAVAGLRISDGRQQAAVGKCDRNAVMGFWRGVRLDARLALCQLRRIEDLDESRAVVEEDSLSGMAYNVSGFVGCELDLGHRGIGCVVVGMVAVGRGPRAGIEHLECLTRRDHDVATVAGRVESREAVDLGLADHVERRCIQHQDATVVGDCETWCCRSLFGGCGRGCRGGLRRGRVLVVGRAARNEGE